MWKCHTPVNGNRIQMQIFTAHNVAHWKSLNQISDKNGAGSLGGPKELFAVQTNRPLQGLLIYLDSNPAGTWRLDHSPDIKGCLIKWSYTIPCIRFIDWFPLGPIFCLQLVFASLLESANLWEICSVHRSVFCNLSLLLGSIYSLQHVWCIGPSQWGRCGIWHANLCVSCPCKYSPNTRPGLNHLYSQVKGWHVIKLYQVSHTYQLQVLSLLVPPCTPPRFLWLIQNQPRTIQQPQLAFQSESPVC